MVKEKPIIIRRNPTQPFLFQLCRIRVFVTFDVMAGNNAYRIVLNL